jgi:hypothetical protein
MEEKKEAGGTANSKGSDQTSYTKKSIDGCRDYYPDHAGPLVIWGGF